MKTRLSRLLAVFLTLALMSACAAVTVQADGALTLPSALQTIEEEAFCGDTSLGKVTVPVGTTEIRSRAFANSSLTEITLPGTLTSIADDAFAGCRQFTVVAEEGTYAYNWAVEKGYIEVLPTTPAEFFKTRELENGTLEITGYTGSDTDIAIPAKIGGVQVTSIGGGAFSGCKDLTSIHIPDGVTIIGSETFAWCYRLTSIHIPDSVTSIGNGAFSDCRSLTSIHIPDGVTSIDWYTFCGCGSLTSVNIPDGVTSIGGLAFSGCSGLTSIHIPDGVTSIGELAFHSCSSLTSIHIPESVTYIGWDTFTDCGDLTIYGVAGSCAQRLAKSNGIAFCIEGLPSTPDQPFKTQRLEDGTLEIIGYAGTDTEIGIPSEIGGVKVTRIGLGAFCWCSSLTSIQIPDSVTSIGECAFLNCSSLTSINIPNGVTSIDLYVFYDCSSLTSINIPDGVTEISYEAFNDCSSLTSINIPESVTHIEEWAFDGCKKLTIYGVAGSYAQVYAENHGIAFSAV